MGAPLAQPRGTKDCFSEKQQGVDRKRGTQRLPQRPGSQKWRLLSSSALSRERLWSAGAGPPGRRCSQGLMQPSGPHHATRRCPRLMTRARARWLTPGEPREPPRSRKPTDPPLVLLLSAGSLPSLKPHVCHLRRHTVSSPSPGSLKLSASRGCMCSPGAGLELPKQPHLSSHPPPKQAAGSAPYPHSGDTQSSARLRPLPGSTGRPSRAPFACALRRARSAAGAAAAASPAGWGPGGRWRAREAAGGREERREGSRASA